MYSGLLYRHLIKVLQITFINVLKPYKKRRLYILQGVYTSGIWILTTLWKKKRIDFLKKNWTIYVIYISALANLAVNFIRPEVTTKSNPLASWQESRVASICSSGWCGEDQSIRIYLFSRAVTKKKKIFPQPSVRNATRPEIFFFFSFWRDDVNISWVRPAGLLGVLLMPQ